MTSKPPWFSIPAGCSTASAFLFSAVWNKDELAMARRGKTGRGRNRRGDCRDLTRWVAQLDATHRQACAAYVQAKKRDEELSLVGISGRDRCRARDACDLGNMSDIWEHAFAPTAARQTVAAASATNPGMSSRRVLRMRPCYSPASWIPIRDGSTISEASTAGPLRSWRQPACPERKGPWSAAPVRQAREHSGVCLCRRSAIGGC